MSSPRQSPGVLPPTSPSASTGGSTPPHTWRRDISPPQTTTTRPTQSTPPTPRSARRPSARPNWRAHTPCAQASSRAATTSRARRTSWQRPAPKPPGTRSSTTPSSCRSTRRPWASTRLSTTCARHTTTVWPTGAGRWRTTSPPPASSATCPPQSRWPKNSSPTLPSPSRSGRESGSGSSAATARRRTGSTRQYSAIRRPRQTTSSSPSATASQAPGWSPSSAAGSRRTTATTPKSSGCGESIFRFCVVSAASRTSSPRNTPPSPSPPPATSREP